MSNQIGIPIVKLTFISIPPSVSPGFCGRGHYEIRYTTRSGAQGPLRQYYQPQRKSNNRLPLYMARTCALLTKIRVLGVGSKSISPYETRSKIFSEFREMAKNTCAKLDNNCIIHLYQTTVSNDCSYPEFNALHCKDLYQKQPALSLSNGATKMAEKPLKNPSCLWVHKYITTYM
jgi:hypothetical protein